MNSTKINNSNYLSAHTPVLPSNPVLVSALSLSLGAHPSTHINPLSAPVSVPLLSLGLNDYNNNYNCYNNCNDKIDAPDKNVKGKY